MLPAVCQVFCQKFLDVQEDGSDAAASAKEFGPHKKATLLTLRHIIKGSSGKLPFAALNEYLCMQVLAKVLPSAKTEVSRDGNALVMYRFDVDDEDNSFGEWRTFAPC
jgi:serine/threonine-protein kinase HipA